MTKAIHVYCLLRCLPPEAPRSRSAVDGTSSFSSLRRAGYRREEHIGLVGERCGRRSAGSNAAETMNDLWVRCQTAAS